MEFAMSTRFTPFFSLRLISAVYAACFAGTTWAAPTFKQPDADFQGRVSVASPVVLPGRQIKLTGAQFKPGQQVQFFYEGQSITGNPVTVDAEGKFQTETTIPATAEPGRHPVVVSITQPSAAVIHMLKVSPDIPLSGADAFSILSSKTVTGVYQSAYSPKSKALFVTAAIGRPPVKESTLAKLNPDTLEVLQEATPPAAPDRADRDGKPQPGGVYAVYGVGVDDQNGTVWVSNTRQNTVAVYRQSDLELVKQFEPGIVSHGRDVLVDARQGKVFVNGARSPQVEVFDGKTLEKTATISLEPAPRARAGFGAPPPSFSGMSMTLDEAGGKLYVVSADGDIAIVDTASNAAERVISAKGAVGAIGIAVDPASQRAFVVSQGSDNVVVADLKSGETLNNVLVGAGALGIAFEPVKKLVYVANRGAGTLTALDTDGRIVANLDGGPAPNHIHVAPEGVVYALNKGPADKPESNNVRRIQAK